MHQVNDFRPLPDGPTAAACARTRIRRVEWPAVVERQHDAELLVSELVSNALRYGLAPIELAVECGPEGIEVRVRNRGVGRPELLHPDSTDEHGRGLVLVDVIADKWGVESDTNATVVWFALNGRRRARTARQQSRLARQPDPGLLNGRPRNRRGQRRAARASSVATGFGAPSSPRVTPAVSPERSWIGRKNSVDTSRYGSKSCHGGGPNGARAAVRPRHPAQRVTRTPTRTRYARRVLARPKRTESK